MLDGRRKSIQPTVERLPDGNMQALRQFVASTPRDRTPVRRRFATGVSQAIDPDAWVIDGTSFSRAGNRSAGAVRRWCGALGEKSPCQAGGEPARGHRQSPGPAGPAVVSTQGAG
ncbi:transposase [Nocardiopsis dassonvillei]|uniref:transposase n=1 Tax=Nocardiopsis dassonvillei TaxID=2014 RepID=UPI00142F0216|nr:transposase [Nocardiopsis dassonvillei]